MSLNQEKRKMKKKYFKPKRKALQSFEYPLVLLYPNTRNK